MSGHNYMFKAISHYWQRRRERFYLKNRWHLVLDFSLMVIILMLAASLISLYFYHPSTNGFGSFVFKNIPVDLNNPPLDLSFQVANPILKINQPIVLKINYKNNGESEINQLKINLNTSDKNFSLSRLVLPEGSPSSISGREIILPTIKPQASGELELQVYFAFKNLEARTLNWRAQSTYLYSGQTLTETQVLSVLNLASELKVSAMAYYNSPQGDQLGAGPLPPVVGRPTNYWIFWEAKSNGDFKNLVVSAKLPRGVELATGRSLLAGELKYNAVNRQLVWLVPEISTVADTYRASFEVQLIPTKTEDGLILPLITDFKYYATDALTQEGTAGGADNLTTNLEFDRLNQGQGKVISQP